MKRIAFFILFLPALLTYADQPLEISFTGTKEGFFLNALAVLQIKNNTDKTIIAYEYEIDFYDIFGDDIGEYPYKPHKEKKTLKPDQTTEDTIGWTEFDSDEPHTLRYYKVTRIVFEDGTMWINENDEFTEFVIEYKEVEH